MKIIFDQGTPVLLQRYVRRHTMTTVYEQCQAVGALDSCSNFACTVSRMRVCLNLGALGSEGMLVR